MEDYNAMTYYELKAECRKLKLDSKGKRGVLLERLGVTEPAVKEAKEEPSIAEEPEPEIKAFTPEKPTIILAATQEDLDKYLPNTITNPNLDTDPNLGKF